ncbi:MAG: SWIM zinc finger family protein [Haloarculaceae archaeon]
MPPVRHSKTALAPDLGGLDPRARRAWRERMSVTPIGGGCYLVDAESGETYAVDLLEDRCTCPDHQYRREQCKHLRRVAIEITQGRVPPPGERLADCAHCHRDSFVPETADPPLCDDCRLEAGDVVRDRERGDRLVVRRVLPDRADEFAIRDRDQTVAEYEGNAGYPDDDLVVEVVYLEDAARRDDSREYAFPYSRLRRVDDAQLVDFA